jgi:hypothetical protein
LTPRGQITFDEYYVDDTKKGQGTHYKFTREMIDEYIASFHPEKIKFESLWSTQLWLWLALEKFPPK